MINLLQIYEKLRYIDSQFNTFDSQNAFCESNFIIFLLSLLKIRSDIAAAPV